MFTLEQRMVFLENDKLERALGAPQVSRKQWEDWKRRMETREEGDDSAAAKRAEDILHIAQKIGTKVGTIDMRDGPQSTGTWNMILNRDDREEIAGDIAEVGYKWAEVSGGQLWHKAIENGMNPFDLLKTDKKHLGKVPASSLFRGANLFGFEPRGTDVIDFVVRRYMENGGGSSRQEAKICRVFDAANDEKNVAATIAAVIQNNKEVSQWNTQARKNNSLPEQERGDGWEDIPLKNFGHIQAASSYQPPREVESINDRGEIEMREIYGVDYYVGHFQKLIQVAEETGGKLDSLVVKDMSGQLTAEVAEKLIPALRQLDLPVFLHIHATNYEATLATIKQAAKQGIDGVEVATGVLAKGSSHADVRDVFSQDEEENLMPIDLENLTKYEGQLRTIVDENMRTDLKLDEDIRKLFLSLGIPGGAFNAVKDDIERELAPRFENDFRTAALAFAKEMKVLQTEMRWIQLVTPTANTVCKQAVWNVMTNGQGRFAHIDENFANLVLGYMGDFTDHARDEKIEFDPQVIHSVLQFCGKVKKGEQHVAAPEKYPEPQIALQHPTETVVDEMKTAKTEIQPLLDFVGGDYKKFANSDELAAMHLMRPPGEIGKTAIERILISEEYEDKLEESIEMLSDIITNRSTGGTFQKIGDGYDVQLFEHIRGKEGIYEAVSGYLNDSFSLDDLVQKIKKDVSDSISKEPMFEHCSEFIYRKICLIYLLAFSKRLERSREFTKRESQKNEKNSHLEVWKKNMNERLGDPFES